jgi:hypothetical protein
LNLRGGSRSANYNRRAARSPGFGELLDELLDECRESLLKVLAVSGLDVTNHARAIDEDVDGKRPRFMRLEKVWVQSARSILSRGRFHDTDWKGDALLIDPLFPIVGELLVQRCRLARDRSFNATDEQCLQSASRIRGCQLGNGRNSFATGSAPRCCELNERCLPGERYGVGSAVWVVEPVLRKEGGGSLPHERITSSL